MRHQILFDTFELQREFRYLHRKLYEVLDYAAEWVWFKHKDILFVTSIRRTVALRDGDTHYCQARPYRFLDCSLLSNGGREGSENLRTEINRVFTYDPTRPILQTIPALDHGTGPHFHFQVMGTELKEA